MLTEQYAIYMTIELGQPHVEKGPAWLLILLGAMKFFQPIYLFHSSGLALLKIS